MEEIVNRAMNVVKSNPEWITCIKEFNEPSGFMISENYMVQDIKTAIEIENPIHSGCSIALCLQQCREILNEPTPTPVPAPHYRVFH
jgi:hypothetical protein